MVLETAGSLKNGRNTWVLARSGNGLEVVSGDKINSYFLFHNSFDGYSPIRVAFVKVRVVCQNTLNMALHGAPNTYKVRHTASAAARMEEVISALKLAAKYGEEMETVFGHFVEAKVAEMDVEGFIREKLFPPPRLLEGEEETKRSKNLRKKKADTVLGLYESGAGTEIKGVKGSVYGVLNAVVEYADHIMRTRGADEIIRKENKFASVMGGTALEFKDRATDLMIDEWVPELRKAA
jgi:phage/plasmid-like protein (TIGR03299 family)